MEGTLAGAGLCSNASIPAQRARSTVASAATCCLRPISPLHGARWPEVPLAAVTTASDPPHLPQQELAVHPRPVRRLVTTLEGAFLADSGISPPSSCSLDCDVRVPLLACSPSQLHLPTAAHPHPLRQARARAGHRERLVSILGVGTTPIPLHTLPPAAVELGSHARNSSS